MPPAPFEFEISHTEFRIIFTNYGTPMFHNEVTECVSDALVEIKHEIDTHWTDYDIPISENLVFTSGPAQLELNTARYMYRTYCLMLLVGILEWGQQYGFIEVDMEFVEQKSMARRSLGTGSLQLSDAAS